MPVLKAKVNNQWVPISSGGQEVAVGPDDPIVTDPNTLLWYDTVSDQLLVSIQKRWTQATQGTNEVYISPLDPATINPGAELWFDTRTQVLNVRLSGDWKPVFAQPSTGSEVEVADVDPYVTDPQSTAELWLDTSVNPAVLKARVADVWETITTPPVDAPNEVQIGGADPSLRFPEVELWYDAAADPPLLKARVNDAWVPVSSISGSEVEVASADPYVTDPASTAELWFDTAANVRALKVREGNAWIIAGPDYGTVYPQLSFGMSSFPGVSPEASRADHVHGTPTLPASVTAADEVLVSDTDPYVADPQASIELWYDPTTVATSEGEVVVSPDEPTDLGVELWYDEDAIPVVPVHGMRAFWEPLVTYQPGSQVIWPQQGADIFLSHRPTLGEEPKLTGVVDTVDFNPGSTTLPQGLSAVLAAPVYTNGVDLRLYFRPADSASFGSVVALTNAANIAVVRLEYADGDPADTTVPDLWRFQVLDNTAVQVTLEVSVGVLPNADLINYPFVRLLADATTNTLSMFHSRNGVDWIAVGTPVVSANPLLLAGIQAIHIGHDNDAFEQNWENCLCAVDTHDYGGQLQTSWWARTQPNVAVDKGIGISPLTGEDYVNTNACPLSTLNDWTTPWSNVTEILHQDDMPANSYNVSWQNGFSGTMDFRVSPALVSMRLHNVRKNSAEAGGTTSAYKMCDYPAGVSAPWADITVSCLCCSDDNFTPDGRQIMVQARTTGVWFQLYGGAADYDYIANARFTCTMSWPT